jgi:integrase/recombinase XerD
MTRPTSQTSLRPSYFLEYINLRERQDQSRQRFSWRLIHFRGTRLPIAANDNEPIGVIYKFDEAAEKLRVSKRSLQEIIKVHPHYAKNGRIYLFCDNEYVRGTVRKQSVFESTGTDDKKAAEAIRIKREARLLADSIHGKESTITFFEAAVSYMAAGGSPRFLGEEIGGKWTLLLGHFETRVLHTVTQDDLNAAADKLYPNTQYDTRNRQCFTPFIAVWNHALPDSPRKWKRPKKPKGTNVKRLKPVRAGTKPVSYDRASEFVLAMSPANAMVMTGLFYTGMRPIELFVLSDTMVNVPGRWITLEHTKIGEPRGIPIHEFLVPLLTALVKRGGILFRSPRGTPYPVRISAGR